jgi:hypothetical protein
VLRQLTSTTSIIGFFSFIPVTLSFFKALKKALAFPSISSSSSPSDSWKRNKSLTFLGSDDYKAETCSYTLLIIVEASPSDPIETSV